jgi:hypothetical protein
MCGTVFTSPQYYNKVYCTPKCRRRAKNLRESGRTPEEVVAQMTKDERFFRVIDNPTEAQLNTFATLILDELTDGKPVGFTNLKIMWKAPEGLIWNLQEKLQVTDPDMWVMFHPAMVGE